MLMCAWAHTSMQGAHARRSFSFLSALPAALPPSFFSMALLLLLPSRLAVAWAPAGGACSHALLASLGRTNSPFQVVLALQHMLLGSSSGVRAGTLFGVHPRLAGLVLRRQRSATRCPCPTPSYSPSTHPLSFLLSVPAWSASVVTAAKLADHSNKGVCRGHGCLLRASASLCRSLAFSRSLRASTRTQRVQSAPSALRKLNKRQDTCLYTRPHACAHTHIHTLTTHTHRLITDTVS